MLERMAQDWWMIALRGVAAIVFGVLALIWPGITLLSLVFLFAAYALVDGVIAIATGIRRGGEGRSPDWWRVVRGIVGVAAAVIAVVMPGLTALALLYLIAAWAIIGGVVEIVAAYRLREVITREWLLAVDGVLGILFGIVLIVFPGAGALAVVWLIGAFAIVSGVALLVLAFRLRGRAGMTGSYA
jgi:uncharacterized membrane protein HdeD (DUF308 family)